MLGLGIDNASYTVEATSWDEVYGLVAHYDFSDASKLKQEDDGTTAVSSNNDPIGYAENLVSNGLGTFIRSYTDAGRPLYKTGGANSKSYAQFDGSSDCGLVAGVQSDGDVYGGISASAYSDVTLYFETISIFVVCKADVEDISSEESAIHIRGVNGSDQQTFNLTKPHSSDNAGFQVVYGGDPATHIMIFTAESNWTTEDRLMSIVTASGPSATRIEKNDGVALNIPTGSGEFSFGTILANEQLDMRTIAGKVGFSIGSQHNAALNTNSKNFEGRIYEVLIYNRSITTAERTLIKNYINTKYDLWS